MKDRKKTKTRHLGSTEAPACAWSVRTESLEKPELLEYIPSDFRHDESKESKMCELGKDKEASVS